MPSDDRDQQFDRALARHLRSASPDAACPDAEVLAAYHERSLSFEEMARWKTHIASCLRCRETLALLEETDSVAANDWEKEQVPAGLQANRSMPAGKNIGGMKATREMLAASAVPAPVTMSSVAKAAEKPGRRVPWSVAVPAGALAAGLLVWLAVHEGTNFSMKKDANVQVAENRETLPPVSSTAPQTLKAAPRDEGAYNLQPGIRTDRKTSPALSNPALPAHAPTTSRLAVPPPVAKESGASQQDNLGQLDVEKSTESLRAGAGTPSGIVAGKRAVAAAPAPPKAVGVHGGGPLVTNQMQNQMQNQNTTQNANQAPNQAANQSADLAGNQPLAGEKKDAQAAQKQKGEAPALYSTTGSVEVSAAEAPFTGRASSVLRLRNGNIITITAPNKNQAWRIGPVGKLDHTTDTGRSWKPQTSGVTADLLAGSAPSDKVCWIAGKAGTLLLTTDGGEHWRQIASPIADDLGGVRALDAQHAAIWDVPTSRSFETSDGGLTWTLLASQ
ncbi:MAG TPA: YCF48-related protein [Candidatus Dormibacteraeota bacterium]|nr:YCF48-related protein [Candidatus Dormibacteraeota bacterium]